MDVHYVLDQILNKHLDVRYVPSDEQLADYLTKPLSYPQYPYLWTKLALVYLTPRLRGDIKDNEWDNDEVVR